MRIMHKLAAILALVASGLVQPALAQAPAVPVFVDETATSGITTSYDGDWFYIVGGGVGAFDCNGDGYEDIVLPGGESKAQLYVNTSKQGGSLTFAPEQSGLEFDSVSGFYREIVPNRKLVFTWTWQSTPERESQVTIEIAAANDGSLLTLTHERFINEKVRDDHGVGWGHALDTLERLFA